MISRCLASVVQAADIARCTFATHIAVDKEGHLTEMAEDAGDLSEIQFVEPLRCPLRPRLRIIHRTAPFARDLEFLPSLHPCWTPPLNEWQVTRHCV